ncbi:MAG: sodium:solute symporter, partial [Acidiphilium sp. 21-68-69]
VAPGMSPSAESQIAKLFSIVMVIGALIFIFGLPQKYAIQLQLLGGMWMIQIFPSIVFSLFTRFYNGWALLVGWAVGIGLATHFALLNHLKGSIYPFHIGGVTFPCYIALATFVVNVLLATVLSPVFHAIKSDRTRDVTSSADYA